MLFSRILYQIPTFVQRMFRGVLWRKDTSKKCVYLTFDDGPIPEVTPQILDILDKHNVKATFFWVGENVYRYPDLAREVVMRGHQVGNHTFNHMPGLKTKNETYYNNVELCSEVMRNTLGSDWVDAKLFRPPYGRSKWSQRRWLRKHYQIVLWDVITHDYSKNYHASRIVKIVCEFVRNGSIILFHDSIKSQHNTLEALPKVIRLLKKQGYTFETL
ncbi:MAG: polysaccharide deacetylase family protein [Paludibacteraceae bacterium]|nr:polysaccharide deacetylase family protein [Paludibacteraceae bacterium]